MKTKSATLLENVSLMAVKEAIQTIEAMLCDTDFNFHVLSRKVLSQRLGAGKVVSVRNRHPTVAVLFAF